MADLNTNVDLPELKKTANNVEQLSSTMQTHVKQMMAEMDQLISALAGQYAGALNDTTSQVATWLGSASNDLTVMNNRLDTVTKTTGASDQSGSDVLKKVTAGANYDNRL